MQAIISTFVSDLFPVVSWHWLEIQGKKSKTSRNSSSQVLFSTDPLMQIHC